MSIARTEWTCPQCHGRVTVEHLRTRPECMAAVRSLMGLYSSAKRQTVGHGRGGGRPPVLRPCPKCGQPVGGREARHGHAGCLPGAVAS